MNAENNENDSNSSDSIEEEQPIQPQIDPPPVEINQVSPIAGALSGEITVTITGSGFQTGAIAYFGSRLAKETKFESHTTIKAIVPEMSEPGSVLVTVVNPDGSQFTQIGGFTYVTMENSDRAEVFGVAPLTVIEEVETEITLRGRNLILAYNEGLVALRGVSRVDIKISKVTPSEEDGTGIEALTLIVYVSASLPLEPLERIAIQVLASRRAGARDDLIVESSKQMFTVLPRNIPVPLAYSPSLSSDKPTMVVVLGRALEGCTLEFGDGTKTHLQKSDERSLVGIVTVSDEMGDLPTSTQMSVLDEQGNAVAQYTLSVAPSSQLKKSDPLPTNDALLFEGASRRIEEIPASDFTIDLASVPGQQFLGPTANDSAVYDLRGELPSSQNFNWFNFEIIIADFYIILPIINEVYLFPLFDGGGATLESPILTQVGKLFPVRGSGILFAVRFEITIHITIILLFPSFSTFTHWGYLMNFPGNFHRRLPPSLLGSASKLRSS